jgi:hypothetical protein
MKHKSKGPVPPTLPRERLTKKALEGINEYTVARIGELPEDKRTVRRVARYVLEAERMRRRVLYAWLEKRGYRWNGVYWSKSQ